MNLIEEISAITTCCSKNADQLPFELIKIERVDPETRAVLGGRYFE